MINIGIGHKLLKILKTSHANANANAYDPSHKNY